LKPARVSGFCHTSVQPITHDVLAEKYLKPGETDVPTQLYQRVARALASAEKPELRAEWEAKVPRQPPAPAPLAQAAS
jgi:ribonucleotide reductase alpha subunit